MRSIVEVANTEARQNRQVSGISNAFNLFFLISRLRSTNYIILIRLFYIYLINFKIFFVIFRL